MGPHTLPLGTEKHPVRLKLGQSIVLQRQIRDLPSLESAILGAELRLNSGTIARTHPTTGEPLLGRGVNEQRIPNFSHSSFVACHVRTCVVASLQSSQMLWEYTAGAPGLSFKRMDPATLLVT